MMAHRVTYDRLAGARDDWETPQALFERLDKEFHFTLDAAASCNNTKCVAYFTKDRDGLAQVWPGTVWVNPPYGRSVGKWVEKAYQEWQKGATVVMLLAARTDTQWFHKYIYQKAEVRFVKGRLRFGNAKNSAPFPSMVVIWKAQADKKGEQK